MAENMQQHATPRTHAQLGASRRVARRRSRSAPRRQGGAERGPKVGSMASPSRSKKAGWRKHLHRGFPRAGVIQAGERGAQEQPNTVRTGVYWGADPRQGTPVLSAHMGSSVRGGENLKHTARGGPLRAAAPRGHPAGQTRQPRRFVAAGGRVAAPESGLALNKAPRRHLELPGRAGNAADLRFDGGQPSLPRRWNGKVERHLGPTGRGAVQASDTREQISGKPAEQQGFMGILSSRKTARSPFDGRRQSSSERTRPSVPGSSDLGSCGRLVRAPTAARAREQTSPNSDCSRCAVFKSSGTRRGQRWMNRHRRASLRR